MILQDKPSKSVDTIRGYTIMNDATLCVFDSD
jgi:hypothetical protein